VKKKREFVPDIVLVLAAVRPVQIRAKTSQLSPQPGAFSIQL